MQVPFYKPSISEEDISRVVSCLRSGWLTTGIRTQEFESQFAQLIGVKHAVALNSCTAALHLALESISLKRGDLVIVPTMTFAATAEVVRYFDAIPVFVDCDPKTLCMDMRSLKDALFAISQRKPWPGVPNHQGQLKAIIPMHYAGQMADMVTIRALALQYECVVIEDAAHTLPAYTRTSAQSDWEMVGQRSDIACFSFYANKCITTGEGGMLVTNHDEWAKRARMMSLHGLSKDAWKRFTQEGSWYYEIVAPGYKYNLTDIAASLGSAQLMRVESLWMQRKTLAKRYQSALERLSRFVECPQEQAHRQHSWHLFAVQLKLDALKISRDQVINKLKEKGVTTSVHYMPLHLHPYYLAHYPVPMGTFKHSEQAWTRLLTLPLYPSMTSLEQEYVVESLTEVLSQ